MARIFLVMLVAAGLFLAGAYYAGLLTDSPGQFPDVGTEPTSEVADIKDLGDDLYKRADFPLILNWDGPASAPVVLHGIMNPIDIEEVPSQVPGQVLFIGDPVDDALVLAAGSAPFLAEPYNYVPISAGVETNFKFYRRHYEGKPINEGQMLAMIQPAKALAEVEAKTAKVKLAMAEHEAAIAGEAEGYDRYVRADKLYNQKPRAIALEDLGAAKLTWKKLEGERKAKEQSVRVAEIERKQALIDLSYFELRSIMPFKQSAIKTIVKQTGAAAKQLEPVLFVQNLDRLQAEALIEEQYLPHLKDQKVVTATIEPTIIDRPMYEFPGHDRDVTSIAVTRDRRIVSGSEDKSVCVWKVRRLAPLRRMEHDDAVRVVACSPAGDKQLCVAGCANGSIYIWDLDGSDEEPLKLLPKAHGDNAGITSVAFSPDGKSFASGGSDGSIIVWSADGTERYKFEARRGVAQNHEDAVTALHFTQQCRLVSAGRDRTLRVWQLKEKGAVADRKPVHDRHGNVAQLGVSNDGKWMLFDQGHTLKLHSVQSHTWRHILSAPANSTPFETLAIFSPDDSLILTAGAAEGRLQLWRTPGDHHRGFEVRQFATRERLPVTCAAFAPLVKGEGAFAVSASGHRIYAWTIPTQEEVKNHPIRDVRMSLMNLSLDPATKQARIGFEVQNPHGRFEAGRPVTIVIE